VAHSKRSLGALAFMTVWLGAATASAFCRTTTCDALDLMADCSRDANGCATTGIPLAWPTQCVSFGVQKDGSPLRHITYQTFDGIVQTAFNQWTATQCGGAHPAFKVWDLGAIDCGDAEFNKCVENANTWMFRDKDWPYVGITSTLALTTITFELRTGKILDADVEVNSFTNPITTSAQSVIADLQSIATHEAGHFLGLAHSGDSQATMYTSYSPGDLSFRSLADDDHAGICEVYPPSRPGGACDSPVPLNGFSRSCADPDAPKKCESKNTTLKGSGGGCAVNPSRGRPSLPWAAMALGALVLRRRQHRPPR
jgi:MYXO-CTERM domain-containing protein